MRVFLLVVLLLSIQGIICNEAKVKSLAAASARRYCNQYPGDRQKICIKHVHDMYKGTDPMAHRFQEDDAPMLSGRVGVSYDISKAQFGLPALGMTPSGSKYQGFAVPKEAHIVAGNVQSSSQHAYTFKTYDEYVKSPLLAWSMTPVNVGQASLVAGMMSHTADLQALYKKYFSGPITLAVSHDRHVAYTLKAASSTLDPYFEQALEYLPAKLDSTYDTFLDYWGTHYTTETQLGGLMEQQTFLRDCVWSRMSNGQLLNELKNEVRGESGQSHKKPDGTYVNYRKLGSVDIVGGNPEFGRGAYAKRVASFAQDPVQIAFTVNRISGLVKNPTIHANLERAINNRIAAATNARKAQKAAADRAHEAWFKGPQSIGAGTMLNLDFSLNNGKHYAPDARVIGHQNVAAGHHAQYPLVVRERICHKHCKWFRCHTNCADEDIHIQVGRIPVTVTCERNAAGAVRARTSLEPFFQQWPRRNAYVSGVSYIGPWVTDGCSTAAPYNPHYDHAHGIDDFSLMGSYKNFYSYMLSAYPRNYWGQVWPIVEELAASGSAVCCIGHGLTTTNIDGGTRFSGHCPPF